MTEELKFIKVDWSEEETFIATAQCPKCKKEIRSSKHYEHERGDGIYCHNCSVWFELGDVE